MRSRDDDVLDVPPKKLFAIFLRDCLAIDRRIDACLIADIANRTVAHLRNPSDLRNEIPPWQALEQRWYASLNNGNFPDYGVYADDGYLGELWACWTVYSRPALRAIRMAGSLSPLGIVKDVGKAARVVDLGCGCGYTTAALKQIFPRAEVVGTNFDEMVQTKIAVKNGQRYGFSVVPTVDCINAPADLVFASEYFEHIQAPVAHLNEVLKFLDPRALLIANAFGRTSIGHFTDYDVDGKRIPGDETSALFNAELRSRGYEKIKTKLWNNRPAYWKKTLDK